jgi:hypothetical protein
MGYLNTQSQSKEQTIASLNELLRGELSAVESYDKALPAVDGEPRVRADLLECRASHEDRAQRIREAILQVGGEPAHDSGAWGLFARSISGGARALGWKTVVTTLEEGEGVQGRPAAARPRPATFDLERAVPAAGADAQRAVRAEARIDVVALIERSLRLSSGRSLTFANPDPT